ncbi:MAG: hypothetical protein SFX73_02670 [Kofleriaceae bacterium]|nr:hypothetical protein [Kofleriaceae bacterium]
MRDSINLRNAFGAAARPTCVRLAVLLAVLSATAYAGNRNELTLGGGTRALRSNSANAVTDESLGNGNLTYGRRIDIELIPRLETWVTGGFHWGGTDGALFQMSTEIDTLGFTAGGRLRYLLHPNLAVAARLDLGTARTALAIDGAGHRVSDSGWGGTFGGAVGVDAYAIAHRTFSFGARIELGYVAMTSPALSPREDQDDTMIHLDAQQASIGHLDLGGRYFSFSMLGTF